jgi:Ca2+/Na+ antiporter
VDPDNESVGDTFFVLPDSTWPMIVYVITLPVKFLIYVTTPDVRRAGREHQAILSITISFVWLGILTYVLIEGLGILANLLHVNSSVMGLTVGAWAASYPALWSSVVVARSGFGDMAVCNALGSNIFSNFIGLGLPWLSYVIVYNKPYAVLEDDGVVISLSGLMVILLLMYLLVASQKWVLKSW